MSDISLLMTGVLTDNPASLPDQFPVQSPIQSDTVGQNSIQESFPTFPHADITPPEFLQVDMGEGYGCVDYPSKADEENLAITHDQFVAALETCLQQIDELLTNNIDNTIELEDFILLQRLQNEVELEIAQLQQRLAVGVGAASRRDGVPPIVGDCAERSAGGDRKTNEIAA
ncbi:hypothetical protein [Anabaena sp. UHCC 0399]|uniref:hypothetical protein n=1 Tax=Anabaena sp. UHCC 0399 TaxID=3110238 RepID=UPI002B2066F8|nr:hypothetical protein [Anabaena sp. UHCC 0399]MEA5566466.1 hypothetical protein [Anabaena sp. UHCC 0399]